MIIEPPVVYFEIYTSFKAIFGRRQIFSNFSNHVLAQKIVLSGVIRAKTVGFLSLLKSIRTKRLHEYLRKFKENTLLQNENM